MSTRRPIIPEDLLRIKIASDPQLSPDGRRVVFAVKVADDGKNKYWSHLWMANPTRQFTHGEVSDTAPRWSPDGTQIAFLRTKEKRTQIWLIPADGGEAWPLTRLDEGHIGEPRWSPDGRRIAFTFRPTHPDFTEKAREEREKSGKSMPARHITRLRYRLDGYGWLDCREHVWVCDVATGSAVQLTDGDEDDHGISWSPDSTAIAFFSNRGDDPEERPNEVDLWVVSAEGRTGPTTEFRRIATPPGGKGNAAWSPDGRWIAYTGARSLEDPWVPKHDRIWIVPSNGSSAESEARCLTESLDRGVGRVTLGDVHAGTNPAHAVWIADASALLFLAADRGNVVLYRVSVDGGEPVALTAGAQTVTGFSAASGKAAAVISAPTRVGEVYLVETTGEASPTRLTSLNAELEAELQLSEPEEVWIDSDGVEVQGWVLRPPDFDPARRYPLIFYIHGGPHAQYGAVFFHELQLHAARGYVVLYTNPRGSANLGQGYMDCIRGSWGELDLQDMMAAADFAETISYVDSVRMAVCGGSYGGYSTNWMITHTNRFRCAITDRCVSNLVSWNGQTDLPMQVDGYFPGNPWDGYQAMRAHSPLTYAANCTTPVLILHSEGDWRCPIGQSQELYYALKRLKKAHVELVWYPRETSHGMSRGGPPDLRLDRLARYTEWFDRYLKG